MYLNCIFPAAVKILDVISEGNEEGSWSTELSRLAGTLMIV